MPCWVLLRLQKGLWSPCRGLRPSIRRWSSRPNASLHARVLPRVACKAKVKRAASSDPSTSTFAQQFFHVVIDVVPTLAQSNGQQRERCSPMMTEKIEVLKERDVDRVLH